MRSCHRRLFPTARPDLTLRASCLRAAFASAQLLLRFALLAGHLLAAAVLQLFALVVVGGHFQQPAAVDLDHLQSAEINKRRHEPDGNFTKLLLLH